MAGVGVSRPVILVTGAGGLLGPYLMDAASAVGQAVSLARSSGDQRCDLCDVDAVHRVLDAVRPDIVLHAAAMTDVDGCEHQADAADRANHLATTVLALALSDHAILVAYSTDQVYPDVSGPHVEGSEAPVNVYGKTKLAGECGALRHDRTLVLRTSIFGPSRSSRRSSLSDFVVGNLQNGGPITLFSDVLFSPLHFKTLAELTMDAVAAGLTGVYNAASREGMSKADFGFAVAARFGLPTVGVMVDCSTAMPARAPRATDLRLDVNRIEEALGREMPTLKEEIAKL